MSISGKKCKHYPNSSLEWQHLLNPKHSRQITTLIKIHIIIDSLRLYFMYHFKSIIIIP